MKIAIAGAFGFVGQHLISRILAETNHEIVALSRSERASDHGRMQCRAVDFYSLKQARAALAGCDAAVYLVHSMAPSARLAQGSFRDFDYILADNFGRAAQEMGLDKIVYVGGIIPENTSLSAHLQSRLEVEDVLRSRSTPMTALRCGIVIGPKASSYSIIVKLTQRLPVMILPHWMRTQSNPIYVEDLAHALVKAVEDPSKEHRIVDVGMPEAVTYKQMVVETAAQLGEQRRLIDVPYVSPKLSKLWVRLVSGASKSLVYPLIDSVRHPMLQNHPIPEDWQLAPVDLKQAISMTLKSSFEFKMPRLLSSIRDLSEVRSVQRMHLPKGRSAQWVAHKYLNWLPIWLRPFLKSTGDHEQAHYCVRGLGTTLLTLTYDPEFSHAKRVLYRVSGGVLVEEGSNGRFEFRESHDRTFVIAALHAYKPALPWYIYRWTQALVHKIVMQKFSEFLCQQSQIPSMEKGVQSHG